MLAYTYISPGKFELIDKPKPELQGPRVVSHTHSWGYIVPQPCDRYGAVAIALSLYTHP